MEIINTILSLPWEDITQIVLAVYGAASIIIRLTPTPKDDEFMMKVVPFHQKLLWFLDKMVTASNRFGGKKKG